MVARKPGAKPAFLAQEEVDKRQRSYEIAKAMSRDDMFLLGMIPVEELDDEELRLGQARDYNGQLLKKTGARKLPSSLYDALVQEHARRTNERLRQLADDALNTMTEIMHDKTAEPGDRFQASKYLFERVAGKTPDKVAVTIQKQPWEEVFDGIADVRRATSRRIRAAGETEQEPVDAEEVELRPYGYIQKPEDMEQTETEQVLHPTGEWDEEETPPQPQQPTPQPARAQAEPQEQPQDMDLYDRRTVPDYEYQQPTPENVKAPTHFNPVDSMATAPSGRYMHPQEQERYAQPSVPLSDTLRDRAMNASELAHARKEAQDMRKDAKKDRQNMPEGIARQEAQRKRIIFRAMGFDANPSINIVANVQPNADGTETVRWQIS